jgi:hypothetical protein
MTFVKSAIRRPDTEMNHANDEKSDRLKKVLAVLADGNWHGTLAIMKRTLNCAVSTTVSELRANGHAIECRQVGRGKFQYRRVEG